MAKLTDDQIVGIIEAEEANALGSENSELLDERSEALARYNAEEYGTEREGRSKIVSNMVRDQIEAMMPSIARVFLSGDEIGRFEPISKEDEPAAERETLAVNHCVFKGGGWAAIHDSSKNSLLLKNGFIIARWGQEDFIEVETYKGQSQEELAALTADSDVEIVEGSEYPMPGVVMQMGPDGAPLPPPLVYDVKVRRKTKQEGIVVEAVPPDEIRISERHRDTDLRNADFVQHRVRKTIGELRAEGYDVPDDVTDGETMNAEDEARSRYDEDDIEHESSDPSRKVVTLRKNWIRLDTDGKASLWYVCLVGKTVIHKEEADIIPVANFVAIRYPHSPIGVSVYDVLSDLAEAETVVQRNYLDSLYFATSPAMYVNNDRRSDTTLDDLLTMHPGKVIRGDGMAAEVVQPIVMPDVSAAALQGLQYIAMTKENRTGLSSSSPAIIDSNALNKTATGATMMMSSGQARLEFICRSLAEGVKQLFLIAHGLLLKHSTKPIQIRLKNDYIPINPREWRRRTDFVVSVALGTGAPEQQAQKLLLVGQQLQMAMAMGLAGPRQFYNYLAEFLRVIGYRSPDKFLSEPKQVPVTDEQTGQPKMGPDGKPVMQDAPPPQSPPPEVMAAKAMADGQVQKAQIDGQIAMQKAQLDGQVELQKAQINATTQHESKLLDNATKLIIEQAKLQQDMVNAHEDRVSGERVSMSKEQIKAMSQSMREKGTQ